MSNRKKEESSSVVIHFEGSKHRLKEMVLGAHQDRLQLIASELVSQTSLGIDNINLDNVEVIMDNYKWEKAHCNNIIKEIDNISNVEQLISWLLRPEWYPFLNNDICSLFSFITLDNNSFTIK